MPPAPETQLARYRLIEQIGSGGMGEVFVAYDPQLDRRVAIKVLPAHLAADTVARERLRREALAAAALDHPFICKIFEVGEDAGTLFIAMEYVRGETLFDRMRAGRIPSQEAIRIAGEIAEAIEEAHAANLVHRDLKPANIMLTGQGRVKIMDFGLARKTDPVGPGETRTLGQAQLTVEGSIAGTVEYMSPEQLTGAQLDARSDLFAFGIILCEILIGKHPFQRGSGVETITAILRDPPSLSLSGSVELSPGLMVLIRRLLAKPPQERYSSMTEVRADLTTLAASSGTDSEARLHPPVTLIGRDTERDQLVRHLEAALGGRGSLVLIGGEPGIGKTQLTRAILAEAERRGCFGVVGHCYEMEGAAPYVPFIEALEYCSRVAPRESFRYSIGDSASEIAKLMPELRRIYPDIPPAIELPPEQRRRYLFNAYREFVERSARLTPIVAVFEDLHWADEATLLLLRHLAQTVATIPVLIIGTYRDVDLDVTRPFAGALESWIREKLAVRLALRRLDLRGVQEMLTALSGRMPPDPLAAVIHDETEGNPFFIEEVFQHLNEEGKLFDAAGSWRSGLRSGELEVPQGVRLVIGRRLERLRDETRRILTTAAVLGRSFDLRVLETLESGKADAALDAIEEAEQAQLVEPVRSGRETRYRFVHELVRQTLADVLSLPRRQRLHARIADALERIYPGARAAHTSAIAHHLYQAGAAADLDKTVDYLMSAARLASAGAAHEEALSNADRALSLIEGEHPQQAALSYARAVALRSMARPVEAIDWYERAIALFIRAGDVSGAVEASFNLAYIHLWKADGHRGVAVANRALQLVGTHPSPLLHRLLLLNCVSLAVKGDMASSVAALSHAKGIEAALDLPLNDGLPKMFEARINMQLAQIAASEECAREAISRFRAAGDLWGEAEVFDGVNGALWLGRVREVEALLQTAIPRAERVGHLSSVWAYKQFGAQMRMALGDLEGAERDAQDAHSLAAEIAVGWGYLDYLIMGVIAYYRGEFDKAGQNIRRGMEVEPVSYQTGQFSGALFLILSVKGDPEATTALAAARRDLPTIGAPLSLGSCACLAFVLEGLAVQGWSEEAAQLEPVAEYVLANGPVCLYSQHLFSTSAGIASAGARNWARAESHFRNAIHQADSAPYRVAQPIARYWYADMLLARGVESDGERARELLSEASEISDSIGMSWHTRRTDQRISSLGTSP